MKKLFITSVVLLFSAFCFAAEESRMLINPGRETFVHFPSSVLGNSYALTVFLPEPAVPLSKRYPVVYLLGAGPAQAQEAEAFLAKQKALVVGVNFTESDYQNAKQVEKIVEFVSRELMPYIETNYWTVSGVENRVLAVRGKSAAQVALKLLQIPNLFTRVSFASPADALEDFTRFSGSLRVFMTGTQAELAFSQKKLQDAGLAYGPGFALAYARADSGWFDALPLDYFFAFEKDAALVSLKAQTGASSLSVDSEDSVSLRVTSRLKNGLRFDYIPVSLRISPPYLTWDAARGDLSVLPGAAAGTVKISGGVDKTAFSARIKLKKQ